MAPGAGNAERHEMAHCVSDVGRRNAMEKDTPVMSCMRNGNDEETNMFQTLMRCTSAEHFYVAVHVAAEARGKILSSSCPAFSVVTDGFRKCEKNSLLFRLVILPFLT